MASNRDKNNNTFNDNNLQSKDALSSPCYDYGKAVCSRKQVVCG